MFNKIIKTSILCIVVIALTACSKSSESEVAGAVEDTNVKSIAKLDGQFIIYNKMNTLKNEITLGLVPNTEEHIMRLDSIENGAAVFVTRKDDGTYERMQAVITSELQKQLDDEGVFYEKYNNSFADWEQMSEMKVEIARDVIVEDINELEECKALVETLLKFVYIPGTTEVSNMNVVTSIQDIKKSDVPPPVYVKQYETIEEIDEGIRNGDFSKTGSNFFMGTYKIINQNTILAVKRNNSNITKEFSITPYIAEKLKNTEEKSFDLWYKEFDGKDYIIDLKEN